MRNILALFCWILLAAPMTLRSETTPNLSVGMGWYASEKGRTIEDTFSVNFPDPDGVIRTSNIQTIIVTRLEGPTVDLGLDWELGAWEMGLGSSYAAPGSLKGEGFDRDYFRFEGPHYGLRGDRSGPTTGDSIYGSSKNTILAQAPFDEEASRLELLAHLGYVFDSGFALSLDASYEELSVENRSPGYLVHNLYTGPELQIFYTPLSFDVNDFRHSLGTGMRQRWELGKMGIEAALNLGMLWDRSRYRLYTRNSSLIWTTTGWYGSAGLHFDYSVGAGAKRIFTDLDVFRSSSIGYLDYSSIGAITFALRGYSIITSDIIRIDERRLTIRAGLQMPF